MTTTDPFDYRVGWRPDQRRQGEHLASVSGDGGAYRGNRLLREAGDARHLSLRATLRDPFNQLWVRDFLHSATLDLWVLADLSLSMRLTDSPGAVSPHRSVAGLIRSAAHSARSLGDRLGVFCGASQAMPAFCTPASRHLAPSISVADRIAALAGSPDARTAPGQSSASAAGLFEAAARFGPRPSLVFLVSDFSDPALDWSALLRQLSHHQVVPVVTWALPAVLMRDQSGLVTIRDAESGTKRVLWVRRQLREKIGHRLDQHFDKLNTLFREHGRRPVHLFGGFQAAAMTHYFHGGDHRDGRPGSWLKK